MSEVQANNDTPSAANTDQQSEKDQKIIDITQDNIGSDDNNQVGEEICKIAKPTEMGQQLSSEDQQHQSGEKTEADKNTESTVATDGAGAAKSQMGDPTEMESPKVEVVGVELVTGESVGGPTIEKTNSDKCDESREKQTDQITVIERPEEQEKIASATMANSSSSIPAPVTETPEVSSTKNDEPPRNVRSSRRPSYQSGGRNYGGGYGYQNYGLTYLPYKSNFEPSEDARRRADEFFKTLKL